MATTISPSLGQGIVATQQGAGTSPGYSAIDLRRGLLEGPQEGVIAGNSTEAGGWAVTQRAAGVGMYVDIAANVACARVQGDSVTQQGLYTIAPHSTIITEAIATADATNPRIDQVILEVLDNVHDASGSSLARTRVLTGTPTGGATLNNRSGATALPSNAIRLADVLVGSGVTTLANAVIRDRRPWARGVDYVYFRTAGSYTIASATPAEVDATNINGRYECSGVPLVVSLSAQIQNTGAANDSLVDLYLDGVLLGGGRRKITSPGANYSAPETQEWQFTPSSGSHTLTLYWSATAGTSTLFGDSTSGLSYSVREVVSQNIRNNTLTTG